MKKKYLLAEMVAFEFSDSSKIYKVYVVDETHEKVLAMHNNRFDVYSGFGYSIKEAVKDFIRRNNSIVLQEVFDGSQKNT